LISFAVVQRLGLRRKDQLRGSWVGSSSVANGCAAFKFEAMSC